MDRIKEFINEYKLKIILGLIIVIVALMVVLFLMMNSRSDGDQGTANQANISANNLKTTRKTSSSNPSGTSHYNSTFIDIEGAVKRPGVYQFTNNMRIDDAVNLAGGLNSSADRKHIDLAKKLTDQQTVYIPVRGEIKGLPSSGSSNGEDSTSKTNSQNSGDDSGKINLNSADEKQLQSIDGIGQKRAEKIIEYRKSHGDFKQIDDVKKISGIGDKFFSNIKAHVNV